MSKENAGGRVGCSAAKLVASLKRAQWLPHYDRATLRDVVTEMGELFKHLHYHLDMNRIEAERSDSARAATISFLDTSLRRNRQCVLAYLNYRLEKIQQLAWSHIGKQGSADLPEFIKERLDAEEVKFAKQYHEVVEQYMWDFNRGDNETFLGRTNGEYFMDITTDVLPPKGPDVEIELFEEIDGRPAGSRFYSRRELVEPLVLSGKAKHLTC